MDCKIIKQGKSITDLDDLLKRLYELQTLVRDNQISKKQALLECNIANTIVRAELTRNILIGEKND